MKKKILAYLLLLVGLFVFFANNAFSQDGLKVDANGNIGIGVSTPSTKLEIIQNGAIKIGQAYLSSGGDFAHLANNEWYDGAAWQASGNGALIQLYGQYIQFFRHTNGAHSNSMTIDPSGNIGIGTTSPGTKLDVMGVIQSNDMGRFKGWTATGATGRAVEVGISPSNGVGYIYNYDRDSASYGTLDFNDTIRINGSNGWVGVGTTSPMSKFTVIGNIFLTGKLTSVGGNDPPYVLYNYETRKSIIKRVGEEVPPDKLSGAVLFYNGEKSEMEVFLPEKGEFRKLSGELLETTTPITMTFEVEDRYYLDQNTGEVKSYKAKKLASEKYKIKKDHALDEGTGKFYKIIKDEDGNEIEREFVSKQQAIEAAQ